MTSWLQSFHYSRELCKLWVLVHLVSFSYFDYAGFDIFVEFCILQPMFVFFFLSLVLHVNHVFQLFSISSYRLYLVSSYSSSNSFMSWVFLGLLVLVAHQFVLSSLDCINTVISYCFSCLLFEFRFNCYFFSFFFEPIVDLFF
jgi:hypothetical protein